VKRRVEIEAQRVRQRSKAREEEGPVLSNMLVQGADALASLGK
jgi:hypothetical protein